MYYITEAGEAYLNAWVQACKEYRRVMDALSRAYKSRRMTPHSSEHGEEDEVSASYPRADPTPREAGHAPQAVVWLAGGLVLRIPSR
jgi:hypothetical protein